MIDQAELFSKLSISANPAGASTGVNWLTTNGAGIDVFSPVNGVQLATVKSTEEADYQKIIEKAQKAFVEWRKVPAPQRGEVIRQYGQVLRENKQALGELVTLEMGKSIQEGLGEVQEMIDICDFAVGLSRQLYGLTMHSERPEHRMYEQYHPLGLIGIISAFNFPVAVWAWNAMLAAVCGNVMIWKPSEKTPLTAIACQKLLEEVLTENEVPEGVFNLVVGGAEIGALISNDTRVPLVSATGSTRMGKLVAEATGKRLGRALLELGGNNAIILTPNADIELAIRGIVFGAIGTCGQRCTTTRRLIIHESIYESIKERLVSAYKKVTIGDPFDMTKLVGPLIDKDAVEGLSLIHI